MAKTAKEWDEYDTARVTMAMEELARSPNLRFFFRSLFAASGLNSTPGGGNALETAQSLGRHSVGMDIVATMLEHRPDLYPALILEDMKEQKDRDNVE